MNLNEIIRLLQQNYESIWTRITLEIRVADQTKARLDPRIRMRFMEEVEFFLNQYDRIDGGHFSLTQYEVRNQLKSLGGRLGLVATDHESESARRQMPMKLNEMIRLLQQNYESIWTRITLEMQLADQTKARLDPRIRMRFMEEVELFLNQYHRVDGGHFSLTQDEVRNQLKSLGGRLGQVATDHESESARRQMPASSSERIDNASVIYEKRRMGVLVGQAEASGKNLFMLAQISPFLETIALKKALKEIRVRLHPDRLGRAPTETEDAQFRAAVELGELIDVNQIDEYRRRLNLRQPEIQPQLGLSQIVTQLINQHERILNEVLTELKKQGKIPTGTSIPAADIVRNSEVRTEFMKKIEGFLNTNSRPDGGRYSLDQPEVRTALRETNLSIIKQVASDYLNPPLVTTATSDVPKAKNKASGFDWRVHAQKLDEEEEPQNDLKPKR